MAAIPTILKGDDSGTITLNIAAGRSYAGATLVVAYQGVTRSFTNLTAGGTVSLAFTHEETSNMATGCKPLLMRLIGSTGAEETVGNAEARIKVTDCLAEVNAGGSFSVEPSGAEVPVTELGDVGANYTIAQLQEKINQIVRTLAQRSLLALAVALLPFCMPAAISVQTCAVSNLWSSAAVVTNVTGAATEPGVVSNIVESYGYATTNCVTDLVAKSTPGDYANVSNRAYQATTTNAVNAIIASSNLASVAYVDGEFLSIHGGTSTRASGSDNGVSYTLQGGKYNPVSEGSGMGGAGASLSIGGGGDSDVGTGGMGASLTLSRGGNGDFLSGTAPLYNSAKLEICGHGESVYSEIPANGSLIIQHTGTSSETLTERIVRDAAVSASIRATTEYLTNDYIRADNAAFSNEVAKVGDSTVSALVTTTATHTASIASHTSQLSQLSQSNTQLASSVSAISAHLNAEDAHFVSTNYDSLVREPEAYVEVKVDGSWITIWKEMTRWTEFVGTAFDWDTWTGFHTWGTNVTANISALWDAKADRCWGIYDSETGGYSPEGFTQISSSNVMIAANMAYQRTVTTGGAVWVLQCNNGHATLGGDTNGYFRVFDGDGNCQFEIIQGDQEELGADAAGISVNNSTTPPTVTIPYSVDAADHPTLKMCDNLSTANWKSETDADRVANVTWTGTRNAYTATVQKVSAAAPQALFVKATYMAGGETYINNRAPVGMSSIYLNGTKYYLGTATISGHTVLTLSTTAP